MPLNNFNRILTWSDFNQQLGQPGGANEYAQIHPDTTFTNLRMGRNGRSVTIASLDVTIRLIPSDCWVVVSRKTDELLKHEQGHYDIMAIAARALYNRLLTLSENSTRDLHNYMNDIRENFRTNVRNADSRYDTQTNHGINTTVQQSWDRAIATVKANPNGVLTDLP
jgi:hypothetical protein